MPWPTVSRCTFKRNYYHNGLDNGFLEYHCDERVRYRSSTVCIFHASSNIDLQISASRFHQKLKQAIKENHPLYCLDYYLPRVKFCKDIPIPIFFDNATFGFADFSNAKFGSTAVFAGSLFKRASFRHASFQGQADFSYTSFHNKSHDDIRKLYTDDDGEEYTSEITYSGKADFSRAKFYDKANFSRATFLGWASFENAEFHGDTNFEFARFKTEPKKKNLKEARAYGLIHGSIEFSKNTGILGIRPGLANER